MAQMIPAQLPADGPSIPASERIIFQQCAQQLGSEWLVLHSVHWLARTGGRAHDGEADFIIAHPQHGVLVLEVKGGVIQRDQASGQWRSTDRGGVAHLIKDPFEQAERMMYRLRDKLLATTTTMGYHWRLARAVAFPDIVVGATALGPAAPRALIIDSSDLNTLAEAINRAFKASPGSGAGPGSAGIQALRDLLKPPLKLARLGLAREMLAQEQVFLDLTQQQYRLLDFLGGHRRVAIDGVAGSGKTLLALEQARRLATQGFRVLFTCFNKALAGWAREQLTAQLGPQMAQVTVNNYHDLAADIMNRAGIPAPDLGQLTGDDLSHYFNNVVPEQFIDALDTVTDRFDAIIVDEGQDFADTWWTTLEALLVDPDAGPLMIFYDNNQRIYSAGTTGEYPIPPPHHQLAHNCRTTQQIHEAALSFYHGEQRPLCDGPRGRVVEEQVVGETDPIGALRSTVHQLVVTEGIPLDQIVILSTRGQRTSVLKEGMQIGNFTLTWQEPTKTQLRVRSIHTFKGLESPIVILVEPARAHASNRDQLLYVALSRAQHHLIVLGKLPAPVSEDVAVSLSSEQ